MSKQKKNGGPMPLVANSKITIAGETYDCCKRDVLFSELTNGPTQDWDPITDKVYTGLVQFVGLPDAKLYRLLQPIEQLVYDIALARSEKLPLKILMPTLYPDETIRFIENYLTVFPFGPFSSSPNNAAKALIAHPTLCNKLAYVYSDSPRPKLTNMVVCRAVGINAVSKRTIEGFLGKEEDKDSVQNTDNAQNEKSSSTFPADHNSRSNAESTPGTSKDGATSQQLTSTHITSSVDCQTLDSSQAQELDAVPSTAQAVRHKTARAPNAADSTSRKGDSPQADTLATHKSSPSTQPVPVNGPDSESIALAIWDEWAIANNAEPHEVFTSHYTDRSKARARIVEVISNKEMSLETVWHLHCSRHPSARRS